MLSMILSGIFGIIWGLYCNQKNYGFAVLLVGAIGIGLTTGFLCGLAGV